MNYLRLSCPFVPPIFFALRLAYRFAPSRELLDTRLSMHLPLQQVAIVSPHLLS